MWMMFAAPIRAGKQSFVSIDIVRGLSAIAILVFHFHHFLMGGPTEIPVSALDSISLLHALGWVRKHGGLAVMLFWTISGFVFMNVYAGTRPSLRQFFWNRFARLYPLHFLTLVIVLTVQAIAMAAFGHYLIYDNNDAYHFLLNVFFASEWGFQQGRSFNGPIWSVSVEVLIYALFYVYVRYAPVNLSSIGASWLILMVAGMALPGNMILLCGVFFFGGMASYACYALVRASPYRRGGATAAAALLLLIPLGLAGGIGERLPLTLSLLPLFGALFVLLALSEDALHRLYRPFRFVGDITYSSYLWHSPLQMIFLLGAGFGLWPQGLVISNTFFVAYLLAVCGFAWLSFRWLERPAQGWIRKRLAVSRPAPPLPAP